MRKYIEKNAAASAAWPNLLPALPAASVTVAGAGCCQNRENLRERLPFLIRDFFCPGSIPVSPSEATAQNAPVLHAKNAKSFGKINSLA